MKLIKHLQIILLIFVCIETVNTSAKRDKKISNSNSLQIFPTYKTTIINITDLSQTLLSFKAEYKFKNLQKHRDGWTFKTKSNELNNFNQEDNDTKLKEIFKSTTDHGKASNYILWKDIVDSSTFINKGKTLLYLACQKDNDQRPLIIQMQVGVDFIKTLKDYLVKNPLTFEEFSRQYEAKLDEHNIKEYSKNLIKEAETSVQTLIWEDTDFIYYDLKAQAHNFKGKYLVNNNKYNPFGFEFIIFNDKNINLKEIGLELIKDNHYKISFLNVYERTKATPEIGFWDSSSIKIFLKPAGHHSLEFSINHDNLLILEKQVKIYMEKVKDIMYSIKGDGSDCIASASFCRLRNELQKKVNEIKELANFNFENDNRRNQLFGKLNNICIEKEPGKNVSSREYLRKIVYDAILNY